MGKPWLDRVADELARRGVPARARARLLAELRDHVDDITHEGFDMDVDSSVDARLGAPNEVAAVALREYRRAGWVGRHPLLTFGLLPLPLAVLVLIGSGLAVAALLAAVGDDVPRSAVVSSMIGWSYAVRYVPAVLAAAWLGRLAARHHVGRAWLLVAVGQVALFGGSVVSRVFRDEMTGGQMWAMGFSAPGGSPVGGLFYPPTWWQLPQLLAPLAGKRPTPPPAGSRAAAGRR